MPKKSKLPATRFPNAAMTNYYSEVRKLIEEIHSELWQAFDKQIRPEIHRYRNSRSDADEPPEDNNALEIIQETLERVRESAIAMIFNKTTLKFVAKRFVRGVNKFNRRNLSKQAQVVKAVDPTVDEPWLRGFMQTSIRENVNYIKTIPEEYFNRIERIVFQGVKDGQSITEMSSEIRKTKEVSVNRARFIARDQTGSILGQMTEIRHKNMGVRKFKWKTAGDERVRG